MDRDIPAFNQLIVNKIQQKNMQLHQQRLMNIRSSQQSRISMQSMGGKMNKKLLMQQQKKTQIQKDNLMLFNKMMRIMKRTDPCNRPALNINIQKQNRASMECSKIAQQNRTLYERLQKQKPTINNKKLMDQRRKNLNILKFLGKYSAHSVQNNHTNMRTSHSSSRPNNYISFEAKKRVCSSKNAHYLQGENLQFFKATHFNQRPRYESDELEQEMNEQNYHMQIRQSIEAKRRYLQPHGTEKDLAINREEIINYAVNNQKIESQAKGKEIYREIVLYQCIENIAESTYKIKIVRGNDYYLIKSIKLDDEGEEFVIARMNEEEGNCFLENYDYNYKQIVSLIERRHGTLILNSNKQKSEYEDSKQQFKRQKYFKIMQQNDQSMEQEQMRRQDSLGESLSQEYIEPEVPSFNERQVSQNNNNNLNRYYEQALEEQMA